MGEYFTLISPLKFQRKKSLTKTIMEKNFLAVISSHYIRNLREEVKKGIRGRLKQGLYPFKAHIGLSESAFHRFPSPVRIPQIEFDGS